MDGILVINKATGMTSHDVVARVRRLVKQKRVGHAGTLDPMAQGVLPLCLGQATRVAEYLSESGKAYEAGITFGTVTDTYDTEGTVLRTADTSTLTLEQIQAALPHFLGKQQQLPPRYSAIKLQGQPAYKLARAGSEVQLQPRPIEIYHLNVLAWTPPTLMLAVECSKGTYIRSLAYDLGEYLGYGAHLSSLTRTRSGPFTLAKSVTLEALASAIEENRLQEYLLPADSAVQHFPGLTLDAETAERVLHGNTFRYPALPHTQTPLARVYDPDGRFIALASWNSEQCTWQPVKVFVTA